MANGKRVDVKLGFSDCNVSGSCLLVFRLPCWLQKAFLMRMFARLVIVFGSFDIFQGRTPGTRVFFFSTKSSTYPCGVLIALQPGGRFPQVLGVVVVAVGVGICTWQGAQQVVRLGKRWLWLSKPFWDPILG